MLDAAACGLPVIVSEKVQATERYLGNGLTYREGDFKSLADRILEMKDEEYRRELGEVGHRKMQDEFSWKWIAQNRAQDYQIAVSESH
jgi:glycosyltransferase involved in cell wall biosynthesis